jgi:hypothetical protein
MPNPLQAEFSVRRIEMISRQKLTVLLAISLLLNCLLIGAIEVGLTTRAAMSGLSRTLQTKLHLGQASIGESERKLVACWGDSLTAGAGAGFQEDYPSVLGAMLGREVFKGGRGGRPRPRSKLGCWRAFLDWIKV